jgi:hypothetical protein
MINNSHARVVGPILLMPPTMPQGMPIRCPSYPSRRRIAKVASAAMKILGSASIRYTQLRGTAISGKCPKLDTFRTRRPLSLGWSHSQSTQ